LRFGFVDHPSPRREPTLKPRLGGLALYLSFVLAILISAPLVETRTIDESRRIVGLLVGSTVVLAMGAVDDRFELGPAPQFVFQLLGALIAVFFGFNVNPVNNPFGNPLTDNGVLFLPLVVAIPLTVFWFMGSMNTINFVDGLDGLAAGVGGIAAVVLAVHSLQQAQYSIAVLPMALGGATLGFLVHNFSPAKITMGTSGSVFLGFALASLSIIGGTKAATVLLVLGIPIVDVGWQIVSRLLRGQSPFYGDRNHLHHRLRDIGFRDWQIVLLLYLLCGTFGTLALVLSSRLMKLYAMGAVLLVVGALLLLVTQGGLTRKADKG